MSPIVYHLSDLHIRSGDEVKCRYQEYKYVFNRFVEFLQKQSGAGDAITIITGDIFHHKSKLESPGISLFYNFLKNVAKITPIYIIRGNHDYKQWDSNEVDLISSMLLPDIDNVTYLNTTGTYELTPEIGVGVLAIQDIVKSGSSNASLKTNPIEQLFPKASELNTKYKIALYHGIVENNKAFEGYDVAMLGDIHIQMVNGKDIGTIPIVKSDTDEVPVRALSKNTFGPTTGVPWGYAGSMIRQNVGEAIEGHGFLLWDLDARDVTSFHINNIVDLAAAECEQEILESAKANASATEPTMNNADRETTPCILQNTPEMWEKYTDENGKVPGSGQLIAQPELLILPNIEENEVIQKKVDERNIKIKKKLEAYIDSINGNMGTRNPFRILKMNWDYLLCYGANNQFYFNKLDGKVNTISGRNGHGKTSFLEIILLALYGQGFPSRANKNNTASIINIHKPSNAKSQVTITLQIDNLGMVKVSRAFIPTLKPTPSSNKNFSVDIWDQETNKWTNVVIGRTLVDKWVDTNVGTIDSFLLSCMVSQNADCDFFALTPADQKEMLDNALSIDTHSKFMELLKEARLGYQALADLLSSALASVSKQLQVSHATHAERIAILDAQIASGSETGFAHIGVGDVLERKYYEDIVAKGMTPGRNVDDIIYEMEQIKRIHQTTSRNGAPSATFDKSEEWYQAELDAMPDPPPTPKTKIVPYNETLYVHLQETTRDFDNNNGFDIGPYNNSCKCCNSRMKALEARSSYTDYVNQWWAKKTHLETALSSFHFEKLNALKIELAEAKSYEKSYTTAKQILDSYDLIQNAIKITALKIERGRLFHEYEAFLRVKAEQQAYTQHLDTVQDKLKSILDANTCLDSYINWLYVNNVIPLVEKYTNEIMNLIDPNLKLRGSMNEKGFEWSIATTSAAAELRPTIEKASGFQRFICGLAVRIALGTIGASGIKPRQLFLDEGFTSCDSTNLSKVPNFLTMLLQLYDSILLVTHLEDLKDFCIESTVQIGRDTEAGTSFLR